MRVKRQAVQKTRHSKAARRRQRKKQIKKKVKRESSISYLEREKKSAKKETSRPGI